MRGAVGVGVGVGGSVLSERVDFDDLAGRCIAGVVFRCPVGSSVDSFGLKKQMRAMGFVGLKLLGKHVAVFVE